MVAQQTLNLSSLGSNPSGSINGCSIMDSATGFYPVMCRFDSYQPYGGSSNGKTNGC